MIYHIFAFILNGVVKDTWHVYGNQSTLASMRARAVYGDNAIAVDCTTCYVQVGDTYDSVNFYHNGVLVPAIPDVYNYDIYFNEINQQLDDLVIAVTPTGE